MHVEMMTNKEQISADALRCFLETMTAALTGEAARALNMSGRDAIDYAACLLDDAKKYDDILSRPVEDSELSAAADVLRGWGRPSADSADTAFDD